MLDLSIWTTLNLDVGFAYCLLTTIIGCWAITLIIRNVEKTKQIIKILIAPNDVNFNEDDKELYKIKKLLKDFISLFFNSPL